MALAMASARNGHYMNTPAGKLSHQLAYFSLALGALELFAAPKLTKMLGMRGKEDLVRAYGVREIVKGVGILSSSNPTPWLWGRVAGDALDLATLASAYPNTSKRANVAIAIANVATVTMLDVMAAQQMGAIYERQRMPARDYSDRSGLPRGIEASRGAAADAPIPADMRTPELLRPYATA
jgi:hypothetical protein